MRNWLSTNDIARLARRTRAHICEKVKGGTLPGKRVNRDKPYRVKDEPEIRAWCKTEADRKNQAELCADVIEFTVRAIRERDLDKIIRWEIARQLLDSDDPDRLVKKWERAVADRPDDLPRVDMARAARHIFVAIWEQLTDSDNEVELLRKWQRALIDEHPEELPRVIY